MQMDRLRDGRVFRWVVCLVSVELATFMTRTRVHSSGGRLFSGPDSRYSLTPSICSVAGCSGMSMVCAKDGNREPQLC